MSIPFKHSARAFLLLPLVALWAMPADQTHYYEVSGTTAAEVRAAMNRLRPASSDGQRHDALTTWHIRWHYAWGRVPGGCAVTRMDVTLETAMTLPHWTNASSAPASLVERWRKYYAALVLHENGHEKIAADAAAAIRDAGTSMPAKSTCAEVGPAVNARANGVLEQYKEKERKYDADTGHGRTQGARFP